MPENKIHFCPDHHYVYTICGLTIADLGPRKWMARGNEQFVTCEACKSQMADSRADERQITNIGFQEEVGMGGYGESSRLTQTAGPVSKPEKSAREKKPSSPLG